MRDRWIRFWTWIREWGRDLPLMLAWGLTLFAAKIQTAMLEATMRCSEWLAGILFGDEESEE